MLIVAVAVMSAFVKNIGALAIMMPIAFQMARASGTSLSCYLMPMAFASLLGGLMTLVGTSPNIIVSRMREEMTGEPFSMFDYHAGRASARRGGRGLPRASATACCPRGQKRRAGDGRSARHPGLRDRGARPAGSRPRARRSPSSAAERRAR